MESEDEIRVKFFEGVSLASVASPSSFVHGAMQNEEGTKVDLYIPRKWYAAQFASRAPLTTAPPLTV